MPEEWSTRPNAGRESGTVVVANRRPFTVKKGPKGTVVERSAGGLVAALLPILESSGGTWVAWDGVDTTPGSEGVESVRQRGPDLPFSFRPVRLSAREVNNYYYGFANRVLWPICHYFIGRAHFDPDYYRDYAEVNRRFAAEAAQAAGPAARIWIHDYHFALAPRFLREARSGSGPIGLFWHIPFPAWEVFRAIPWRRQILAGMLGADIVGFHLEEYAEQFRRAVRESLGYRSEGDDILCEGRRVNVRAVPIGIDAGMIEKLAGSADVGRRAAQIRERLRVPKLVLSVDRLDYSKGITERLAALERFFELHPERRRQVVFVQIAVPSRARVEEYHALKRLTEEAVGRINGRLSAESWVPVHYLYRSIPLEELLAYYRAADVALVTPLRDGMNLVAMEYVMSQADRRGSLVLSELAGVSAFLGEAITVSPFDTWGVANAIEAALVDSPAERQRRLAAMQERIRGMDVFRWHERFWEPK